MGIWIRRTARTSAPAAVILVRLLVGCVFLSEGIQKFLFPQALGVGRFAKIGIPWPEVSAPFVGVCETACGGAVPLPKVPDLREGMLGRALRYPPEGVEPSGGT